VKNRVALITGASRGIGSAIADYFLKEGAKVLAPSHKELDLSSDESVDDYLVSLNEEVDIIVNNAGINPLGDITELKDPDIEDTLRINLISPMRLIRGLVKPMINKKYGRIVNISSIWGSVSKPRRLIYSASKAGLNAITGALAVELSQHNILTNAVAPGFVNTELTKQNNTEDELKAIASNLPIGRLAEPEEIAGVVTFLCSSKNTFITGQVILADGGFSCL